MDHILDKQFDKQFLEIEKLIWNPWVGKDYINIDKRNKILIVGQSQYAIDEEGKFAPDTALEFKRNRETTREYVYNTISEEVPPKNFYHKLLKIFGIADECKEQFWRRVAFYHFFQDVDKQVSGNNHYKSERMIAWNTWGKVIDIIKPNICIFCGKGMHHYYSAWNRENGEKEDKWEDVKNTGLSCTPIKGSNPKLNVDFLFIKHPSRASVKNWNDFLNKQIPEKMEFLNSK